MRMQEPLVTSNISSRLHTSGSIARAVRSGCRFCWSALASINLREMLINASIILALVFLLAVPHGYAQSPDTLSGTVARVVDGDTVVVRVNGQQTRVRLSGIDAPESNQPHGRAASLALERKVAGKEVQVLVSRIDRHGRTVGILMLDGRDINLAMVQNGHAWHFESRRAHAVGANEGYAAAQRSARLARKGLWAQANPVEPWKWRN